MARTGRWRTAGTTPGRVPGIDPVGVGPNGKLTTKDPRDISLGALTPGECDGDRMRLAAMDNRQFFIDLMDEANAGNASFYPIDPRGLAVFDNPIGPGRQLAPAVEMALLKKRLDVHEDAGRQHRWHGGRRQQRPRQGAPAHLRRFDVLLPPRIPLDELETRRQVPRAQGQGQAAWSRRAREARLQSRDGGGSQLRAPGGGCAGPRSDACRQCCARPAWPRSTRRAVPHQRGGQRGQQARDLGCR